jgi:hypothetical protein
LIGFAEPRGFPDFGQAGRRGNAPFCVDGHPDIRAAVALALPKGFNLSFTLMDS